MGASSESEAVNAQTMIKKILMISHRVVAIEPYMNINFVRACLVKVCVDLTHSDQGKNIYTVHW